MSKIGLIVNPAAGRDIRRLTGGATVVDNYAKRRIAECVLDGLTAIPNPPDVLVMPDRPGIADHVLAESPSTVDMRTLEMPIEGSSADTRRAAAQFCEDDVGAVVVLGGDGTTRDVATEIGDVPMIAVSTGTNNVVPSNVEGTVAGVAAALVASETVSASNVTTRHGMVNVRTDSSDDDHSLTALAASEVSARSFIGSRALLEPSDLRGGVVSRAHPADIGLASVAGAIEHIEPDGPGGMGVRLTDPGSASRTVQAVLTPGMTTTVGIEAVKRLEWNEPFTFELSEGVIGADGERELECTETTVELTPVPDGPRLVDVESALAVGADAGAFETVDR